MKLFLIEVKPQYDWGGADPKAKHPWNPWYDKVRAMVVWAPDEDIARGLAACACGDEGMRAWLDSKWSTVFEVSGTNSRVVLQDTMTA